MLDLLFEPFPILETQRLTLRKISMNDASDIFVIRRDAETMKYISRPLLHSIAEAQNLIGEFQEGVRNKKNIIWGISVTGHSRLVGTIGFRTIDKYNHRAEIGYVLGQEMWGKGYATEAIEAVIKYGFSQMGLHSIEARVNPDNQGSSKVLLKQKFVKEAHFKEDIYFDGQFRDTEVYSLRTDRKDRSNK
jgi:[ribosomal protein S5]-alanine N-acetyltransferase